jgi:hypothetical protein
MTKRPARFKQADVSRALRGAERAGMKVGRVEIDADGKIVILVGSEAARASDTPDAALEKWIARHADRNARN